MVIITIIIIINIINIITINIITINAQPKILKDKIKETYVTFTRQSSKGRNEWANNQFLGLEREVSFGRVQKRKGLKVEIPSVREQEDMLSLCDDDWWKLMVRS